MADDPHDRPASGDPAGPGQPARPGDEPADAAAGNQPPGSDPSGPGSSGQGDGLDTTRAFPAPGDEVGRSAGGTERLPAVDGTAELPGPQGMGGAADTRRMHGARGVAAAGGPAGGAAAGAAATGAAPAGEAGRWSGRAGVPRPAPADQVTEFWSGEPPRRRSLMPVLIGLVVLALLALIGYGVWLALRPKDTTPAPAPAPSAAATSRSATRTASPPAPTTTRPRPTQPVMVAVPPVTGLPLDAARAALGQLGLRSTVREVPDPAAPGTVIQTDPAAGTEIEKGSVVTLVVAKAPPPTSAPPSPSASAGG